MMEFLEFTFSSLWRFGGVVILIAVVLNGLASIIHALRGNL